MVAATTPGTQAHIGILRKGQPQDLAITLGTLSSDKTGSAAGGDQPLQPFGIVIQPLTPDLARRFNYENQQGVVITEVVNGSPADQANLQPGDLITAVNRISISDTDGLREALSKSDDSKKVLLLIQRKGGSLFVVLQAP